MSWIGAGATRGYVPVWLLAALLVSGCDVDGARDVSLRFRSQRWIHRAELRAYELASTSATEGEVAARGGPARAASAVAGASPATVTHGSAADAWLDVAALYARALEALVPERIDREAPNRRARQLSRLRTRALLGRGEAWSRAGQWERARTDFESVLLEASRYPGARAQAAQGVARNHDRAGSWALALQAFQRWMQGVRDGEWPLDNSGVDLPIYVSRRLGDRAQHDARRQWVQLASAALEAAAQRGERARDARYARFVLLLDAKRWDAALAALRLTSAIHDPNREDGSLILAEANLLAGALARPSEAMDLLTDLYQGQETFDVAYRVAGSLLAGQIQVEAGNLELSQGHYERAVAQARSVVGRAEATLGLARVHAARGNIEMARRHYAQLREAYPATPAGLLGPLEEYRLLRENDMQHEASALLSQAVHHYRRVISHFGTELPALRAAGYMSECLGLSGSWEHSVAFLDSVAEAFASDPRAGSLLVRGARLAVGRLGDVERASALLRRVRQRYPQSDLAVAIEAFEDSLQHVSDTDGL